MINDTIQNKKKYSPQAPYYAHHGVKKGGGKKDIVQQRTQNTKEVKSTTKNTECTTPGANSLAVRRAHALSDQLLALLLLP